MDNINKIIDVIFINLLLEDIALIDDIKPAVAKPNNRAQNTKYKGIATMYDNFAQPSAIRDKFS